MQKGRMKNFSISARKIAFILLLLFLQIVLLSRILAGCMWKKNLILLEIKYQDKEDDDDNNNIILFHSILFSLIFILPYSRKTELSPCSNEITEEMLLIYNNILYLDCVVLALSLPLREHCRSRCRTPTEIKKWKSS